MADILIRNVPDRVLATVDDRAARLGVSRNEYLRRRLQQDAASALTSVSAADLATFADAFADLADPSVMADAWR